MPNLTDDQRDELTAAINAIIAAAYEYETSHIDAGNNYAHMPAERWTSTEDTELMRQLAEFDIDTKGLEPDVLSSIALDTFTMESGSIYIPRGLIILDSFEVGEIETQIDLASIVAPSIGTVTAEHLDAVRRDIDAYLGSLNDDSALLYSSTDCVWYAVLTPEAMQEAINDYIDR